MIRTQICVLAATVFVIGACRPSAGGPGRLAVDAPAEEQTAVSALGRIEPDELVRLAGPARPAVVVAELLVDEGDTVAAGDVVAVLDSVATEEAEVEARRVELANAELELERARSLRRRSVTPQSELDRAVLRRDLAAARLRQATAELERSRVKSPIAGRVIDVHVRDGERVEAHGIMEIADVTPMFAIAEVYETDVGRVRPGQAATVRARALPGGEVRGKVVRVGSKIGRRDVLDTDPVADADARVVEVEIELEDDSAASLINLQVEVTIDVAPPEGG